jgi:hypothetical protein
MSTGNQYAVRTQIKGFENKIGVYPTGTHNPYNRYMGRILKTAHTRQVRGRVGTPITSKNNNLWIKFFGHKLNPIPIEDCRLTM